MRRTRLLGSCVRLAPWALLLLGVAAGGEGPYSGTAPASQDELVWRCKRACGVNCLYVLLRDYRIETDYDGLLQELYAAAPEGENSLADLTRAAEARGLPLVAARTTPFGLRDLEKPVIVHIEPAEGDSGGHFVLVLDTTDDAVTVMDGTTATITRRNWREFNQRWSGCVLLVKPPLSAFQELLVWASCLGLGGALGYVVNGWLSRRRTAGKTAPPGEPVGAGVAGTV